MKENSDELYRIEQFSLDEEHFDTLAELITKAFLNDEAAQKEGTSIVFDKETFTRMFGSPFTEKDIFVRAIYIPTNELVGFIGCIPRKIKINDRIYKCAVPAWAATHQDHQRRGLALQMGKKIYEILLKKDYEIGFSLFEPKQKGINTGESVARNIDALFPLQRLLTIKKFLGRIFDAKLLAKVMKLKGYEKLGIALFEKLQKVNNPRVRKFEISDAERLFELMDDHVQRNQMSLVREHDDFIWYLKQPSVNCVVHEDENGIVDGFILAWKFSFAGFGNIIPFGWLDLIHTYRLNLKEATDLCKYLAITSKDMGWAGLQTPLIPYFDTKPFKKSKFLFFSQTLTMDVFRIKEIPFPEPLESFYFDWR